MHITISKHAAERAHERGITEEGIRAIADGIVHVVVLPSEKDPDNVDVVLGPYDNKLWAVIVNNYTANVITVRRAHKKEEKIYDDR